MKKLSKEFLGNNVAVVGCGKADNLYYKRLYKHFTRNNIRLLGMPTSPPSPLGFETYPSFDSLPRPIDCAFVLSGKEDTPAILGELERIGVKRVVFFSKACADDSTVADLEHRGIEARMGCPLMLFAPGPCWLHCVISGVKRS